MQPFALATGLLEYLQSLTPQQELNDWVFDSETNIAYSTPTGPWPVSGYLFRKKDGSHSIILRSVPNDNYIVLESVNIQRQLYNIKLTDSERTHLIKENYSILRESYILNIGGMRKSNDVKKAFEELGERNDFICKIDDDSPDWENTVVSLLNWGVLREKVKIKLKDFVPNENPNVQPVTPKDDRNFPLNQILFGPPGTGKTFNSINRAVAIIEKEEIEAIANEEREDVKKRFDEYIKAGNIVFTTFHQSMSYEDFIEGIKPEVVSEETEPTIIYKTKAGIFKELAEKAKSVEKLATNPEKDKLYLSNETLDKVNFFKTSLGNSNESEDDEIFDYCFKNNVIAIGWGDDIDFTAATSEKDIAQIFKENGAKSTDYGITALKCLKFWMKKGDIVFISNGNTSLRAIAQIDGDYFYKPDSGIRYSQFRPIKWLATDLQIPVSMVYGKNFTQQAIYQMTHSLIKREIFQQKSSTPEQVINKNFVLIIDEINRGNVSQIFGELITLIEEDKRIGKDEALEVTLPYSKDTFGVPDNLYIIGTMNTADRSVEALDAALRRRFSFEEMPPVPELIATKGKLKEVNGVLEGIDLVDLLRVINKRIEKLLDKDHQIGHSYFMSVTNTKDLKAAFQNKIIPLLQEYFFGDYGKIGLVLGEEFFEKPQNESNTKVFSKFFGYSADELAERPIFKIKNIGKLSDSEFISAVVNLMGN